MGGGGGGSRPEDGTIYKPYIYIVYKLDMYMYGYLCAGPSICLDIYIGVKCIRACHTHVFLVPSLGYLPSIFTFIPALSQIPSKYQRMYNIFL